MEIRKMRKKEHIDNFMKQHTVKENYFDYLYLENDSLPDLNLDDIQCSIEFFGKVIEYPMMINAITGGCEEGFKINRDLSTLAKKYNIAFAVGSQSIAINNPDKSSFEVIREVNESGVVIGNLSANKSIEDAKEAVKMVKADAIQLHLNAPQELVMYEGDREFKGILDNIKYINDNLNVPVIVKEVGFGISRKTAEKIINIGIKYIDISGVGGTDFICIEDNRNMKMDFSSLYSWGIQTAHSIVNVRKCSEDIVIIASGGIRNAKDIAKALALGANIVGISGVILNAYLDGGIHSADKLLEEIVYQFKMIMLITGCSNLKDLSKATIFADERFNMNKL